MSPDDPRHGSTAGHQAHRRAGETACDACRKAKTRYEKERSLYGDRMVPALGTRRRVRALKALGHSGADIAERLGVTYQAIHKIERGTADQVFARTAENIARIYEEMSMVIPIGYHRTRIRNRSARLGYAPPLAWDNIDDPNETPQGVGGDPRRPPGDHYDEAVVLRILGGEYHLSATDAERRDVVRRWDRADPTLTRHGKSDENIGKPSLAYLGRLTGWKPERYRDQEAS